MVLPGLAPAETHTVTYYIPDAQGSPIVAIDRDSGTVKWRKHYRPYGAEIEQGTASQANRIGYTGHVHDRSSGLTYMGHRYYDPYRGQFNSMDPAAVDPNDPRTFSAAMPMATTARIIMWIRMVMHRNGYLSQKQKYLDGH